MSSKPLPRVTPRKPPPLVLGSQSSACPYDNRVASSSRLKATAAPPSDRITRSPLQPSTSSPNPRERIATSDSLDYDNEDDDAPRVPDKSYTGSLKTLQSGFSVDTSDFSAGGLSSDFASSFNDAPPSGPSFKSSSRRPSMGKGSAVPSSSSSSANPDRSEPPEWAGREPRSGRSRPDSSLSTNTVASARGAVVHTASRQVIKKGVVVAKAARQHVSPAKARMDNLVRGNSEADSSPPRSRSKPRRGSSSNSKGRSKAAQEVPVDAGGTEDSMLVYGSGSEYDPEDSQDAGPTGSSRPSPSRDPQSSTPAGPSPSKAFSNSATRRREAAFAARIPHKLDLSKPQLAGPDPSRLSPLSATMPSASSSSRHLNLDSIQSSPEKRRSASTSKVSGRRGSASTKANSILSIRPPTKRSVSQSTAFSFVEEQDAFAPGQWAVSTLARPGSKSMAGSAKGGDVTEEEDDEDGNLSKLAAFSFPNAASSADSSYVSQGSEAMGSRKLKWNEAIAIAMNKEREAAGQSTGNGRLSAADGGHHDRGKSNVSAVSLGGLSTSTSFGQLPYLTATREPPIPLTKDSLLSNLLSSQAVAEVTTSFTLLPFPSVEDFESAKKELKRLRDRLVDKQNKLRTMKRLRGAAGKLAKTEKAVRAQTLETGQPTKSNPAQSANGNALGLPDGGSKHAHTHSNSSNISAATTAATDGPGSAGLDAATEQVDKIVDEIFTLQAKVTALDLRIREHIGRVLAKRCEELEATASKGPKGVVYLRSEQDGEPMEELIDEEVAASPSSGQQSRSSSRSSPSPDPRMAEEVARLKAIVEGLEAEKQKLAVDKQKIETDKSALAKKQTELEVQNRSLTQVLDRQRSSAQDQERNHTAALTRATNAERDAQAHLLSVKTLQDQLSDHQNSSYESERMYQDQLSTIKGGQSSLTDRLKSLESMLAKERADKQSLASELASVKSQVDEHRAAVGVSSRAAQEATAKHDTLELAVGAERRIMAERDALFHAFEARLERAEETLRQQDKRCAALLGKAEGREELDDFLTRIKGGVAVKKDKTAGQDIDDLLVSLREHIEDLADELNRVTSRDVSGQGGDSLNSAGAGQFSYDSHFDEDEDTRAQRSSPATTGPPDEDDRAGNIGELQAQLSRSKSELTKAQDQLEVANAHIKAVDASRTADREALTTVRRQLEELKREKEAFATDLAKLKTLASAANRNVSEESYDAAVPSTGMLGGARNDPEPAIGKTRGFGESRPPSRPATTPSDPLSALLQLLPVLDARLAQGENLVALQTALQKLPPPVALPPTSALPATPSPTRIPVASRSASNTIGGANSSMAARIRKFDMGSSTPPSSGPSATPNAGLPLQELSTTLERARLVLTAAKAATTRALMLERDTEELKKSAEVADKSNQDLRRIIEDLEGQLALTSGKDGTRRGFGNSSNNSGSLTPSSSFFDLPASTSFTSNVSATSGNNSTKTSPARNRSRLKPMASTGFLSTGRRTSTATSPYENGLPSPAPAPTRGLPPIPIPPNDYSALGLHVPSSATALHQQQQQRRSVSTGNTPVQPRSAGLSSMDGSCHTPLSAHPQRSITLGLSTSQLVARIRVLEAEVAQLTSSASRGGKDGGLNVDRSHFEKQLAEKDEQIFKLQEEVERVQRQEGEQKARLLEELNDAQEEIARRTRLAKQREEEAAASAAAAVSTLAAAAESSPLPSASLLFVDKPANEAKSPQALAVTPPPPVASESSPTAKVGSSWMNVIGLGISSSGATAPTKEVVPAALPTTPTPVVPAAKTEGGLAVVEKKTETQQRSVSPFRGFWGS